MITFNRNTQIRYPIPFGLSKIAGLAAISPYWSLAASRQPNGSGTFYHALKFAELISLRNEIRTAFDSRFKPAWGFQVTWLNIVPDVANSTLVRLLLHYDFSSYFPSLFNVSIYKPSIFPLLGCLNRKTLFRLKFSQMAFRHTHCFAILKTVSSGHYLEKM